jgi:endonuclease YncB( thermonuclease family)
VGIGAAVKWLPQLQELVADATLSDTGSGELYRLVPGSVYDGDTLRVTDGSQEIKIRLCGIDAPEIEQPMGVESRDHLRSLIAQGDGSLIVVPVEQDRYGRTLAEIFVPLAGTEEEIHLTSQMVLDGYAYHYARYSDGCPNGMLLAGAEERARAEGSGVWEDANAVKPWDYRRR